MVYMFLGDGLEEIEALCPVDMMRRAGIEVTTVGVNDRLIHGAHGITFFADTTISELSSIPEDAQMIILPGGLGGTNIMDSSDFVKNTVMKAYNDGKYVCAICAAPMIFGKLGILKGKKATCYPGFEKYFDGGEYTGDPITVDANIITAKGMGYANLFGAKLIEALLDKSVADKITSIIMPM